MIFRHYIHHFLLVLFYFSQDAWGRVLHSVYVHGWQAFLACLGTILLSKSAQFFILFEHNVTNEQMNYTELYPNQIQVHIKL